MNFTKLLKLTVLFSIFSINALSQNEIAELKSLIVGKNYTKAYFIANELLKKDSTDTRLYFYKAEALRGTSEKNKSSILNSEALKLYDKALELDSLYFEPYFVLGELRYSSLKKNENKTYGIYSDELKEKLRKIAAFYFNKARGIKPNNELVNERLLELEKDVKE